MRKIIKSKGHSLWLMPTGEAYDRLSGLIRRLAGKYNAPVFEPHVTLLGEVMQSDKDVLQRAEQVASGQKPFTVTLKTVDYQDFYFRTLFVRADRTGPLQALHDRVKEVFEMQNIPGFMPHLSLLYGNFPQPVKEQIIKEIGRDQAAEFIVESMHLFKTDGETNAFYRVKEIPFL